MTLRDRLSAWFPPDAPATNAAHRALLGISALRVGRRDDRAFGALACALKTTALGRFSADERAWIARIEARRARLAAEYAPSASSASLWSPPYAWSMPRVWGRFLLRLVAELAPRSCIELGAGFGMSALYQAAALEVAGSGTLSTLDQEPSLIPIAEQSFSQLGLNRRIELTSGPIGETLDAVAERRAPIDYALIDAEHTEAATVENFDALRPYLARGAVVVVDDIGLDEEMKRAWSTIVERPGIARTLGLRRLGVVVLDGRRYHQSVVSTPSSSSSGLV